MAVETAIKRASCEVVMRVVLGIASLFLPGVWALPPRLTGNRE